MAEGGILPVTPQDGRIGFTAHRPNLARRQMLWPLYGAKRSTGELTSHGFATLSLVNEILPTLEEMK